MFVGVPKTVLVVAGAYLIAFFALASGLVNAVTEGSGIGTFLLPARGVQTMGETASLTVILFIGMAGIFLLYRAGQSLAPKTQTTFLATGFGVLGIAIFIGYLLVNVKL
jgi:hypothetical protein